MSHIKGLTLIETLMAIALLSILAAISMPNFNQLFANSSNTSNTNAWLSSLELAKSYAVSQSSRVVLCPISSTTQCGSNTWENGWLIFVDTDMDNIYDNTEELLSVTELEQDNKRQFITSTSNIESGLVFSRMGLVKNIPANELAVMTFDHEKSKDKVSITINNLASTAKQKTMK